MPRDDLSTRLDRLAAAPVPPPSAFLARVARRRWARRAKVALPLAACLVLGLVAYEALRMRPVPDSGALHHNPARPVAVAPRPDSLAALRSWDGAAELAPAAASAHRTPAGREPVLRALDGYRTRAGARGAEESR